MWNLTHFLKFASHFFNSVNAGIISCVKIIFDFFFPPCFSHPHPSTSLSRIYQTPLPLSNKSSPYTHMHPALPLNQHILPCPHFNLLEVHLWSCPHPPQAFAWFIGWHVILPILPQFSFLTVSNEHFQSIYRNITSPDFIPSPKLFFYLHVL